MSYIVILMSFQTFSSINYGMVFLNLKDTSLIEIQHFQEPSLGG